MPQGPDLGRVDAYGHVSRFLAVHVLNDAVFDLAHRRAFRSGPVVHHLATLDRGHVLERLEFERIEQLQHVAGLRIQQLAHRRLVSLVLGVILSHHVINGAAQEFAGTVHRRAGRINDAGHAEKAVNHAGVTLHRRRHTHLLQVARVGFALVAQRVVLGGEGKGFGQFVSMRKVGSQLQRSGQRVGGISGVSQKLVPVPHHSLAFQVIAGAVIGVGTGAEIAVGYRINEQLMAHAHVPRFGSLDADAGSQVTPRAISANGHNTRNSTQSFGVFAGPERSRVTVVKRFGELGFRR